MTPGGPMEPLTADDEIQDVIDDLVNEFYYATVAYAAACDTFAPFSPEMDKATSRVNTARSTIEFEMLRDRRALLAARREEEVSEVCPHGWLLARGCAPCARAPLPDESKTLARALVALADELDRNALAVPPSTERMVAEARAALAATPEGE